MHICQVCRIDAKDEFISPGARAISHHQHYEGHRGKDMTEGMETESCGLATLGAP